MKPAKNSAATEGQTGIAATPAQVPPGVILPGAESLRQPPGSFDQGRFSRSALDRSGFTGIGTGGRPAAEPVPEASPGLIPPAPPPQGEAGYRAMVEAFDGLIYISSADCDLEFLNRRFAQRLGIEKLGQKCYRALHQQLDICPWCVRDRVMQEERVYREDFRPQENRWYACTSTPVPYGGRLSQMTIIQDITERKAVEEETRRLAYYDQLTGLPNRSLFNDRLAMALAQARRHRQQVAVMMLDLDRFKDVNDSLGHRVGDTLLKGVAGRLTGLLRESDTVARVGGDEFTLISTGISRLQDALKIARRTLKTFGSPFNCQGLEVRITASLGIALYPDHGEDLDTLVQHADLAMYRAKNSGRRGYRCFSPGQDGNQRRLSRLNPGPASCPL